MKMRNGCLQLSTAFNGETKSGNTVKYNVSAFCLRAADGNRTRDLRTTNATLYRLSHSSGFLEVCLPQSPKVNIPYGYADCQSLFLFFLTFCIPLPKAYAFVSSPGYLEYRSFSRIGVEILDTIISRITAVK